MDRSAIAVAVAALIEVDKYAKKKQYVINTVANWKARPVRFAGADEPLNALIDLGLESGEKLNGIFELIERKRLQHKGSKKSEYARRYMNVRRHRLRKASLLEEIVRGVVFPSVKERKAYEKTVQDGWVARIEESFAKNPGKNRKGQEAMRREFWAGIDRQLDHDLAEAQKILQAPDHRLKRKIQVRQPKGDIGKQLVELLKKKPRKPKPDDV